MKNVLVTGVSGGIGQAVATQLVAKGSSVIGVDLQMGSEISHLADDNPDLLMLMHSLHWSRTWLRSMDVLVGWCIVRASIG